MICVTQGHEKSISIEVFLKSVLQISNSERKKILFFTNKESLTSNLDNLGWDYTIEKNTLHFFHASILCQFIKKDITDSTDSLLAATEYLSNNPGQLFTLPTSKDQLFFEGKNVAGHTEYFRKKYRNPDISMVFSGPIFNSLLITDHIALKDVSSSVSSEKIVKKVTLAMSYFSKCKNIYFSGINPHCGENETLGTEDKVITQAIHELKKNNSAINFDGPHSGDTLHNKIGLESLLVYMSHDQGLAPFKIANGLLGSNISLGLPFLRFSPDHGTAFDLYGKNIASPIGCLFSLRESLRNHG